MTTKRIAYTRPDGGVSIVIPASRDRRQVEVGRDQEDKPILADETEAQWLERLRRTVVSADATDVVILDADAIPSDRSFRDAWAHKKGKFSVHMGKARDIHRARIRRARKPALDALDVAYQRADETGDASHKAEVAARKQALRDAPADPRIDAAKSPDDLHAVWPDELPPRG